MTGAGTCYQHAPVPHHTHTIGGRARMAVSQSIAERFWAKVAIRSADECWEWKGPMRPGGYGTFNDNRMARKTDGAHRVAHTLAVGPIHHGYEIDHLCRNTRCVNPAHLEAVTHRENILRSASFAAVYARKTHCPQGHPYDLLNTKVFRGRRHCVECARLRNRITNRRRRALMPKKTSLGQQKYWTHCKQGHEYTPENTFHPAGNPRRRVCRICQRRHDAAAKARKRMAVLGVRPDGNNETAMSGKGE